MLADRCDSLPGNARGKPTGVTRRVQPCACSTLGAESRRLFFLRSLAAVRRDRLARMAGALPGSARVEFVGPRGIPARLVDGPRSDYCSFHGRLTADCARPGDRHPVTDPPRCI